MHYAERELFRYTKGSVREHNLLKNQFVHTKFLLNLLSYSRGATGMCAQPMRGYFIRADTPVCPYGK